MTRLLGLLLALVVSLGPATAVEAAAQAAQQGRAADRASDSATGSAAAAKRKVPTREQWLADVKTAMAGSRAYVKQRAADAAPGERLAVNFDIDNTVIATYYDGGGAIPLMKRFARLLGRLDVDLVFNTGRLANQRNRTVTQLTRAGFDVADVCLRAKGETLPVGKQRCRDGFAADGYTLIANVGNNDTDFVGDGYERAYRLPNYGVLG
ncbi:acid phosphatase [Nocardioides anomalus]|uniref:Acid phosphatase n=1 Tax=Nocardioides anomalus TaxID=2712223 RepID=A0A6G6WIM2_9ACTN|nr:HAD family acid phosphatase [Nocardioides anomalus]QIG44993.1 acid phosphatase [Nocardioides anomalus]